MELERINFSELRDAEIVSRMRKCNYEKFKSLVRMHLSFELDLNTDEFDLPCHEIVYEDKGKLRKWNRLSKKHKHGSVVAALASGSSVCSSGASSKGSGGSNGNGNCGGSPPESLHQAIDQGFMFHLQELKEFLMATKNIRQEGIFRKTGSASRQNELRHQIQNDKPLNLEAGGYSAHDCATVFKGYLAELPEPLLTDAHYPAHLQIAPLCIAANAQLDYMSNEEKTFSISSTSSMSITGERLKRELHVLNSIQLLLLLLPDDNRQLLQHIIDMLHNVALQQYYNKMGPDNLATLFAPHLICPRNLPPEALHYLARKMSSIVSYMIVRGQDIFAVPAKLATDIRAYFLERKRKKTMSPEMALDESISDVSTVNTVYTFVDREKTAAATTSNTTDTELAQLYAHIQSMPESSKKRRLIKQFNKQNGQGTPLQLQAMNRLKSTDSTRGAKSLSDSIKKHIFHKGLISRTPKRQPGPSIVLETPNNSSMKLHKQRVLFQSPNPQIIITPSTDTTNLSLSSSSSSSSTSSSSVTSLKTKASSINTGNQTPYIIKSHPLQKSISSSSLLMTQQLQQNPNLHPVHDHKEENISPFSFNTNSYAKSNNSSDGGLALTTKSVSAPVSRQTSSDLQQHIHTNTSITSTTSSLSTVDQAHSHLENDCCVTPLKLISEAARHIMVGGGGGAGVGGGAVDKKTVAWDDTHVVESDYLDNPATPLQQPSTSNDLKSRYKSEPNLSVCHHNLCETTRATTSLAHDMITPITKPMPGKSLTRKLMKGVSMGNLRFPFSTPDSTKRLVRTVSSSLKRRVSDDLHIYHQAEGSFAAAIKAGNAPLLHDMDDEEDLDDVTFEDDPADDCGGDDNDTENENQTRHNANLGGSSSSELPAFTGGSTSYQQLLLQQSGLYRNLDLVTSTPSLLLGRRSMSPITKSTQRMPKAMQESIMTPRSRKPVMVLTTTASSTDQNQTINPTDLSTDEVVADAEDEDETEDDSITDAGTKSKTLQLKNNPPQPEVINEDATSLGGYSDIFKRRQLLQTNQSFVQQTKKLLEQYTAEAEGNSSSNSKSKTLNVEGEKQDADELSSHFKEYLLTRSVLTAAPVDSSFSSHSDDYESSKEMDDIDEDHLNSSLLYCLNGNRPESENDNDNSDNTTLETNEEDLNDDLSTAEDSDPNDNGTKSIKTRDDYMTTTAQSSINSLLPLNKISMSNRLATNPFVILNNARKRAATNELEKMSYLLFNRQNSPQCSKGFIDSANIAASTSMKTSKLASNSMQKSKNKENCHHSNENYAASKNLVINEHHVRQVEAAAEEEYPDETSF